MCPRDAINVSHLYSTLQKLKRIEKCILVAAKLEKEEDQFDFYVLHPACTVGLR